MTPPSPSCASGLTDDVRRSVLALRQSAPGKGADQWTREVRDEVVAGLDAVIQELTVYRGQVLLAQRQDGHWGSVQDRDFADYRSRETGVGRGAALGEVQLAEGLEQMPAVAEAVERGELNLEHAKTLSRLRRTASPEVQGAMDAGALDELVEHARRDKLSAPDLGKQAKAWAAQVDAQAAQDDFDAVRRRRSLTMRKHAGGIKGEFFLDPVAGEELRTALDAVNGRPAADDDRTGDQRMADALTTIAGRTLQVGSDRGGAQVRPHLSLLITQETWAGVMAWRRRYESCGDSGPRPLPHVPPGQLEDGTIVPLRELERLMCDCQTTRMVMTAAGVPLDVGRTERTYTKELRRAITTRDRHCQWPGCRLRASWCEVHHILWFSRGGLTSLDNGITLCSYHHHRIHEHDVRITALPDGFDFHYPSGTHIGTTRRGSPPDIRLPDHRALTELTAATRTPPQLPAGGPASRQCHVPAADRPPPQTHPQDQQSAPRAAPVNVLPPPPSSKVTGPAVASGTPLPSRPSTYATAPALWDSDPPF